MPPVDFFSRSSNAVIRNALKVKNRLNPKRKAFTRRNRWEQVAALSEGWAHLGLQETYGSERRAEKPESELHPALGDNTCLRFESGLPMDRITSSLSKLRSAYFWHGFPSMGLMPSRVWAMRNSNPFGPVSEGVHFSRQICCAFLSCKSFPFQRLQFIQRPRPV